MPVATGGTVPAKRWCCRAKGSERGAWAHMAMPDPPLIGPWLLTGVPRASLALAPTGDAHRSPLSLRGGGSLPGLGMLCATCRRVGDTERDGAWDDWCDRSRDDVALDDADRCGD